MIHLTLRAYEWLVYADTFYGVTYVQPVGRLVCPTPYTGPYPWKEHKAVSRQVVCGVEDVRALYLHHTVKALYAPNLTAYGVTYTARPVRLPTCPLCMVTMDRAVELAPRKAGKYLVPYLKGSSTKFKWVKGVV